MTFKEELQNDFIPAMKRMLKKEAKHYQYLLSLQYRYREVNPMIEKSEAFIGHLETRIKEYEEYVAKI